MIFSYFTEGRTVRSHDAVARTFVWIAVDMLFGGDVYVRFGSESGLEFFTGYFIEKALAVDKLFVFAVILHIRDLSFWANPYICNPETTRSFGLCEKCSR